MAASVSGNLPAGYQVANVKVTQKYSFLYLTKVQAKYLLALQYSINIPK
jgi:hypothetical protein